MLIPCTYRGKQMMSKTIQTIVLFLVCSLGTSGAFADSAIEREKLRLILVQLDNIRILANHVGTNPPSGQRFFFDHDQLVLDVETIRSGIQTYLTPPRSQPRVLDEIDPLKGRYQRERPGGR